MSLGIKRLIEDHGEVAAKYSVDSSIKQQLETLQTLYFC